MKVRCCKDFSLIVKSLARFTVLLWLTAGLCVAPSWGAQVDPCADAASLEANSARESRHGLDEDFYVVELQKGLGVVQVWDLPLSNLEPEVEVYSKDGVPVGPTDVIFAGSGHAFEVVSPGLYCFRVKSAREDSEGGYRVSFAFLEKSVSFAFEESGDEGPNKTEILNATFTDEGEFSFTVPGFGFLVVQIEGQQRLVSLENSTTGELVGPFSAGRVLVPIRPEEYVLRSYGASVFSEKNEATLRYYSTCQTSESDTHSDFWDCATEVGLEDLGGLAGSIYRSGGPDTDYFSFNLDSEQTVIIRTDGPVDTYGTLLDSNVERIAVDDDSGLGGNFKIMAELPAGRYIVRVEGFDGSVGEYIFHLSLLSKKLPNK